MSSGGYWARSEGDGYPKREGGVTGGEARVGGEKRGRAAGKKNTPPGE